MRETSDNQKSVCHIPPKFSASFLEVRLGVKYTYSDLQTEAMDREYRSEHPSKSREFELALVSLDRQISTVNFRGKNRKIWIGNSAMQGEAFLQYYLKSYKMEVKARLNTMTAL